MHTQNTNSTPSSSPAHCSSAIDVRSESCYVSGACCDFLGRAVACSDLHLEGSSCCPCPWAQAHGQTRAQRCEQTLHPGRERAHQGPALRAPFWIPSCRTTGEAAHGRELFTLLQSRNPHWCGLGRALKLISFHPISTAQGFPADRCAGQCQPEEPAHHPITKQCRFSLLTARIKLYRRSHKICHFNKLFYWQQEKYSVFNDDFSTSYTLSFV